MQYVRPKDNVLPFPVQPATVTRAARRAVAQLAVARLITEAEAVKALDGLDASVEEIDLASGRT